MESASIQMTKNYRRTDMDRAIESVFAEYQKELLNEFEIFGLDGSYESGNVSEDMVLNRLSYYGAAGIDNEITAVRFITDYGGNGFLDQVARYMEKKYGLEFQEDKYEDIKVWEEQQDEILELEEFAKEQETTLENLLAGNETSLPAENNPLENIKTLRRKPILELVMPEGREISEGTIDSAELFSNRESNQGYGEFSGKHEKKQPDRVLLGEYLLKQFVHAADEGNDESGTLKYELEYILEGENSDKENIDKVIKKLLLIRMLSNYTCIVGNPEMRAEVEAMSFTLSTLALLPEITGAITQVLILSWAFGESIVDMRSLLGGKKIPLIKTKEYWQLSLNGLSKLGTEAEEIEGTDNANGLSYEGYLRILLFLHGKAVGAKLLSVRALDMVEKRLRYDKGLEWFRIDNCISELEIKSTCNLRRGVTYQFATYYGYQ